MIPQGTPWRLGLLNGDAGSAPHSASVTRPLHIAGSAVPLATSIGVAFHHGATASPEQLLAAADRALYDAKAQGRNTFRTTTA